MIEQGASIADFSKYLEEMNELSVYAQKKYDLLIIPGIEVTNNKVGYHIVGLDVRSVINPNLSASEVIDEIHKQGGLAVACHPYYKLSEVQDDQKVADTTLYLWRNQRKYMDLIDAWEIANQNDLFNVIGLKELPFLANSDFHTIDHLYSWKTYVSAFKMASSIKAAIKQQKVSLTLFREVTEDESSFDFKNHYYSELSTPLLVA